MNVVELTRLEESNNGSIGVLRINKEMFCITLEPPDKENKRSISSIPTGQYICKRYSSAKFPNTFEVTDVTGRTYILFHAGYRVKNTEGCILLGSHVKKLNTRTQNRAMVNSGNTFVEFMKFFNEVDEDGRYIVNEFHLTITEHY